MAHRHPQPGSVGPVMIRKPHRPLELVQLSPVLVLRAGAEFEVHIEGVVGFETADGAACRYRVAEMPDGMESRFTGMLVEVRATEDGTLWLEYESGSSIRVFSDADFEAWSVVGADGFRVVCMPGGQLAVWSRANAIRTATLHWSTG